MLMSLSYIPSLDKFYNNDKHVRVCGMLQDGHRLLLNQFQPKLVSLSRKEKPTKICFFHRNVLECCTCRPPFSVVI